MFFFPNAEAHLATAFGHLARKVVPDSLSFGIDNNFPGVRKSTAPRPRYDLHIGDIILTSTPGLAMQIGRSFTGQDHDHITVVVKSEQVLHIGPPKVRLLPLHRVMEPRREPRVLRISQFSGPLLRDPDDR